LTFEQRRSALKCAATLQRKTHTALALSEQEMWHSWQSAEENDFFYAASPHFTEEYPGFGPCTLIEPEGLSTNLHVFANEQTHIKWNFARIKSSTTALQPAATFTSSKA
jgi:hypothetical protein